ncbi:MAG TPA: hypothetical protein VF997_12710, partial [Polyangia bacterium]
MSSAARAPLVAAGVVLVPALALSLGAASCGRHAPPSSAARRVVVEKARAATFRPSRSYIGTT